MCSRVRLFCSTYNASFASRNADLRRKPDALWAAERLVRAATPHQRKQVRVETNLRRLHNNWVIAKASIPQASSCSNVSSRIPLSELPVDGKACSDRSSWGSALRVWTCDNYHDEAELFSCQNSCIAYFRSRACDEEVAGWTSPSLTPVIFLTCLTRLSTAAQHGSDDFIVSEMPLALPWSVLRSSFMRLSTACWLVVLRLPTRGKCRFLFSCARSRSQLTLMSSVRFRSCLFCASFISCGLCEASKQRHSGLLVLHPRIFISGF